MHVMILNYTFHPDPAPAAKRMWDLACHLIGRGHQVTVLTSHHVAGDLTHKTRTDESVQGIRIRRVGSTRPGFCARAAYELSRLPTADVLLAVTSPPLVAAMGVLFRRLFDTFSGARPRFVYYVMEVYPEAAIASGKLHSHGLLTRTYRSITRRTLEASDAIVAMGEDMKALLLQQYGEYACGQHIEVVHPWANGKELYPIDKSRNPLAAKLGLDKSFNILHAGHVGLAQDLPTLIKAIDLTSTDHSLQWVFLDGGTRLEPLQKRVLASKWTHVRFITSQDRQNLNQYMSLGDVHLISQLETFAGVTMSEQLFTAMAVARPAVMIAADHAEGATLIRQHKAGVVIPNHHGEMLARSVWQLRDSPTLRALYGKSGRLALDQHYDLPIACARLEKILTGEG